jgi:hypothetical protein
MPVLVCAIFLKGQLSKLQDVKTAIPPNSKHDGCPDICAWYFTFPYLQKAAIDQAKCPSLPMTANGQKKLVVTWDFQWCG